MRSGGDIALPYTGQPVADGRYDRLMPHLRWAGELTEDTEQTLIASFAAGAFRAMPMTYNAGRSNLPRCQAIIIGT